MLNDYSVQELETYFAEIGQPKYRAAQVFAWLSKGAHPEEMTNLPATLREILSGYDEKGCPLVCYPAVLRARESKKDGTRKLLVGFADGNAAECVFMKYHYGNTACISSQVGCRMGCRFCASGIGGLVRNLTPGEMLGEVLALEKESGEPVSHIVIMGTGEPMDNYENIAKFLSLIHDPKGKNLSYRNITISTCGVIPGIRRLGDEFPQVNLAISLHAATDEKRSELMPVNKKYPLRDLLKTCREHAEKTGRRITFEYTLIAGENDSPKDADMLFGILKGTLCHVNLIPLNPVKEKAFQTVSRDAAERFAKALEEKGIPATVRRELGSDIDAACGQLRRSMQTGGEERK